MSGNLAYQYEFREQKIGGEVVMISPRPSVKHNLIAGSIFTIFSVYLKGKRCTPFGAGTDLYLTESERYVPDGMIVCDASKIREDGVHGAPDLVVEVLSPSTAKYDRGHKKDVYEACGVREYWLVTPGEKSVYLLRDGRFVLHDTYAVCPDWMVEQMNAEERAAYQTEFRCSLFDDLVIRLEDVFDRVL